MVHHPRHQNIDDIGVDGSAASGLIGLPVEGALFDFQMADIGDRLCNVEQHEIIEKHIGIGGQRGRRPFRLAVAHVPLAKLSFRR